jgi:hypothetical protein
MVTTFSLSLDKKKSVLDGNGDGAEEKPWTRQRSYIAKQESLPRIPTYWTLA